MVVGALCLGRLKATSGLQRLAVHYWRLGVVFSLFLFFIATSNRVLQDQEFDPQPARNKDQFDPHLGERMMFISNSETKLAIRTRWAFKAQGQVALVRKSDLGSITYLLVPPPTSRVILGNMSSAREKTDLLHEDDPATEYFKMLQRPTGFCAKLVRIGGSFKCFSESHAMDGHKLVCLDPEFQIGVGLTRTEDCLAMSFGIENDISFDLGIRNANCEVHMFDTLNFGTLYENEIKYFHFHKFGLGSVNEFLAYPNTSASEVDTLQNIAHRFGLSYRLVNVLKIDIEGAEWAALEQVLTADFLNTVGQIAIEVHAVNTTLVQVAKEDGEFRRFKKILDGLQTQGFQRVSYWDNVNENHRIINKGRVFESAGELLLVNSNWYRPNFRRLGKDDGFNFMLF